MRHTPLVLLVAFALSLFLIVGLVGCGDDSVGVIKARAQQLEAAIVTANEVLAQAREQKETFDALIESLEEGETKEKAEAARDKIVAYIDTTVVWLDKAETSAEIFNQQLEGVVDGFGVADAGVTAIAPLLPQPWGAVLTGLGGLIIGLSRAAYNRWAARKVVKSVDDVVARAVTEESSKIRLAQGYAGNRIVDEAQGKKLALPF